MTANAPHHGDAPHWLQWKRGTGRTTRLLQQVHVTSGEQTQIFVITHRPQAAIEIQRLFERQFVPYHPDMGPRQRTKGVTDHNGCKIEWLSMDNRRWCWHSMTVDGNRGCIMIDPSAIEHRYYEILDLWHRYD